jgi:hypothetical protein
MDFMTFLTQGGPVMTGGICVAACAYMLVKIVPEKDRSAATEREQARKDAAEEREQARKDYLNALTSSQDKFLTTLTHVSDQDHAARHEMANKFGALQMAMYAKLGVPME